jgi:hypothetical protein
MNSPCEGVSDELRHLDLILLAVFLYLLMELCIETTMDIDVIRFPCFKLKWFSFSKHFRSLSLCVFSDKYVFNVFIAV